MINHSHILICFAVLATLVPCQAQTADSVSERLYPGISLPQHKLAKQAMHEFFAEHWDRGEATCLEMQAIEQKNNGLPLSNLLRFAMRSWRALNNEYDSRQVKSELEKKSHQIRADGLWILHKKHFPDSTLAMRLFIEGGLDGFAATLEIRSNPLGSLLNGFRAVRMLDSAHALAPYINDVYFGLGLFQCALAEEPGLVKVAFKILNGYKVSLDNGLAQLRICEGSAYYTREGAMAYLIQFLSPFDKKQAAEKQTIFRTLQSWYPENPYYVFQEIDEGFAFHRDSVFSPQMASWAQSKIEHCDTNNESLRKYINLVRWQCLTIDSTSVSSRPVPFAARHAFSFYPVFLQAAKLRYLIDTDKSMPSSLKASRTNEYHQVKKKAFAMIRSSAIDPMLREYFLWHMEDGLPK